MIWQLIEGIGLDVTRARADAGSADINQALQQDIADMKTLRVERTPGFFVNGSPLRAFGAAQLKALVDQELQKSKAPPG